MADYSTLLRDHVTLNCRSIDRIFMQAYVPKLQSVGQVCIFLRWQRGFKIPSSAAFGKIGDGYVKAIHQYAGEHKIPIVYFKKGQNKEKIAQPYIESAAREGKDRVVLIGIAQEKASVWRSWPQKGQEKKAHPHMDWDREPAFINHFYFYLWDAEWGGCFWKTNAYAPFPIWLWLNGHEWAKRQLEKARVGYEALDNGFRSCADPARLQKICDRLGPGAVKSFFWRWVRRLPSPFTQADLRAGYVYELAFRQFEVSNTSVFDRPQAGRMWFESVIRDQLDIGRPHQIALIFQQRVSRRTPGKFRTRYALRAVGESANQRLCDAEAADAQPAPDVATFCQVTRPSSNDDGLYAAGLRFGDQRVMAILAALVGFCHVVGGFTNGQLVERTAALLNASYTSRQATYDLRRLKRKGLIGKLAGTRRYQLTALGRRVAVLFTKTYSRVLAPGLTALDPRLPGDISARSSLTTAWRALERVLDDFIETQLVAA